MSKWIAELSCEEKGANYMSKWVTTFELEGNDTAPEFMDLKTAAVKALERQMGIETPMQEPKAGCWKRVTDKTGRLVWECNCGWQQRFATNYCPDCGSKMS